MLNERTTVHSSDDGNSNVKLRPDIHDYIDTGVYATIVEALNSPEQDEVWLEPEERVDSSGNALTSERYAYFLDLRRKAIFVCPGNPGPGRKCEAD